MCERERERERERTMKEVKRVQFEARSHFFPWVVHSCTQLILRTDYDKIRCCNPETFQRYDTINNERKACAREREENECEGSR